MEHELVLYALGGLGTVALGYFWIDRKTLSVRITAKGIEIDNLEDQMTLLKLQVTELKSKLASNEEIERLRTKLIEQSLNNMEKNIGEIKGDVKMITETILKSLSKQNGHN